MADYHRMIDAGVLRKEDHVELIEGEIVEMSPIGGRHVAFVNRITMLLVPLAGRRAIVQIQGPVTLSERSEPQPDVAVLRWRADFYADLGRPADTLLVIEVADTSLRFDQQVKLPLYARTGIPEVWIADVVGAVVHVHGDLAGERYERYREARAGDSLAVPGLPGVSVEVADLLG